MRTYLVEYLTTDKRNKQSKQTTIKSDMLINAYQTFIETYEYREVISITKVI